MAGRRINIFMVFVLCIMAILYGGTISTAAEERNSTYSLNVSDIKIEQDGKYQLSVHVITSGDIEVVENVKWSSDNKKAVTVDKSGHLTAVAIGKATITAKVEGEVLTCRVKIVRVGKVAEQFYGEWKHKNGKKFELYPSGMASSLEQILQFMEGKKYNITGRVSYAQLSDRILICFRTRKENKDISIVLSKTFEKPNVIEVYTGKSVYFDIMETKTQKTLLLRVKDKIPGKYVFVGDSRFVGISQRKHDNKDVYIAKASQGLKWFKSQRSKIELYDSCSTVFIIGFGVNDLYNVKKYVEYANGLNLRGKVYFCTVGPVDKTLGKQHGYTVTNGQIQDFNKVLRNEARNYKVLKIYQKLIKSGFNTTDGIHYTGGTYSKLYKYIKRNTAPW